MHVCGVYVSEYMCTHVHVMRYASVYSCFWCHLNAAYTAVDDPAHLAELRLCSVH